MPRLLLMEGNGPEARQRAAALGVESPGEIYRRALIAEAPELEIEVMLGADPGAALPAGRQWSDYAGFVISGSGLHAYDPEPAVTRQIEFVRQAAQAGLPILGSCWGLQIAAMAGGGMVARNVDRAEMGLARKITPTMEGQSHPLLAGRPAAFDAPCIHYDDVTVLPHGSIVLAANRHCPVQAAVIPLGRSEVWAVQYHPEFDLPHLAGLYAIYEDELARSPFFESPEAVRAHIADLRAVAAAGPDSPVAWRHGLDSDVLDGATRRTELRNWLHHAVGR
jgi:GMP synthase (glutamine-hydrolysing)